MLVSTDPFTRVLENFKNATEQIISFARNPDEQETISMILNAVKRFGEKHIDSSCIDAKSKIPEEVLRAAAEMGLFGLTVERKYGGSELSMKGTSRVMELLAQVDRSVGVSIGLHCGLGLRGLIYFGSPELKARYLPKMATGETIASFSITEPDAGSDIAAVKTTAIADGNDLIINGSKCYVTNGGFASVSTIVARTPGFNGSQRGTSMILVPLHLPGIARDAEEKKLGLRGSSTCSLHFQDVRVPLDHIIGIPCRGLEQMNHVLSWGRTLMAAGTIGLARLGLERALEQVTNRHQFNRAIAEFGMVREMIAAMRSRLFAMESAIRLATQTEDNQPGSIAWESGVVKVFCSESAWQIVDDTLQLHGGSGFIEDTGVAILLRDCRITRIFEGANELLRFHLSSAAFTWNEDSGSNHHSILPQLDPPLAEMGRRFEDLRGRLFQVLSLKKKAYGIKVFQRQMDQHRIADASACLYVILACLVRAQGELRAGKLNDDMMMWCHLAVSMLANQVERSLRELDSNLDDLSSKIAASECQRVGCTLKETTV